MALPMITPSIFLNFLFLIFKTSFIEEIPPETTIGIFVRFDKDKVSLRFGPVFVPSFSISV